MNILGSLILTTVLSFSATVDKIEVKSTNSSKVSSDLVKSRMTLRKGVTFSNEALSSDIKSLIDSGYFADVDVKIVKEGNKVNLIVTVENLATVRRVIFKGNEEFDTADLLSEVQVSNKDKMNQKKLAQDKKALIALYEDSSYYGTKVDLKITKLKGSQVDITWEITEKMRYKVGDITFSGNKFFDDGDLEDKLATENSIFSYLFSVGHINRDTFIEDERKLEEAYHANGYLDFKLTGIDETIDGDWVNLNYNIVEGTRYKVTEVKIEGNKEFTADELLYQRLSKGQRIPMPAIIKIGGYYNGKTADSLKEKIKTEYYARGFIDVNCRVSHERVGDTVKLTYKISEGTSATIRDIHISGNRATKDYVVRRELNILPEELADQRKINSAKRRLMNLNYFEEVDIIAASTEHNDRKDLRVSVVEKKTGSFQIGAGFSTEDSVIGSIEVGQSNFDHSDRKTWYTGGGQKMRLRLQLGSESSEFLAQFTEPWLFNKRLSLTSSVYLKDREYDEYNQKTLGTTWSLGRKMDLPFWSQSTGFTIEGVDIDDFESYASDELKSEEDTYVVSKVFQKWTRNSTDNYRFPTRGSKFTARLELQSEIIGAYTNSYKMDVSYDKFINVDPDKDWVLKLGVNFGQVGRISGDDPAIFDRFFAGGPGTVRGFDYREVSPADSNGDSLGGQSLFTATAELRIPIVETVKFIVFMDAGNVWEDDWDYNPSELNASVGFGFRIILPVAPLSIDYGYPIMTDQDHLDDSNGQIHFKIGFTY